MKYNFIFINNDITNFNTCHSLISKIKENVKKDIDYKIKFEGNLIFLDVFDIEVVNFIKNNIKDLAVSEKFKLSYQHKNDIINSDLILFNQKDESENYQIMLNNIEHQEQIKLNSVINKGIKILDLFCNKKVSFGRENDLLLNHLLSTLTNKELKRLKNIKYSYYQSFSENKDRGMYKYFRNCFNFKIKDKTFTFNKIVDLTKDNLEEINVSDFLNEQFKQYFLKMGCEIVGNYSLPFNEKYTIFSKNKSGKNEYGNNEIQLYNLINLNIVVKITDLKLFEEKFIKNNIGKYKSYSIGYVNIE